MYKIAINGFGRIGRNILRALYERPDLQDKIQIVAINDLGDVSVSAHLLQFDTVHGRFNQQVTTDKESLTVNGHRIQWFSERDPANIPWGDLGVDLVCECTGVFTSRDKAALHDRNWVYTTANVAHYVITANLRHGRKAGYLRNYSDV